MKITVLSILLAFTFLSHPSFALPLDPPSEVRVMEQDFPMFKDMDNKIIYLDFELLTFNLKSLKIVKNNTEVSFSDDLSKVDVDAIYEIDYSDYTAGSYELELETYSGSSLKSSFVLE